MCPVKCGMKLLFLSRTSPISSPKFGHGWSFQPTFNKGCNYLSILRLKSSNVDKRQGSTSFQNRWYLKSSYCPNYSRPSILWKATKDLSFIQIICILFDFSHGSTYNTTVKFQMGNSAVGLPSCLCGSWQVSDNRTRPPSHDKYINIDYPLHNPHLDTLYCAVMKTWHSCAWSYCSVRLYLIGLANNMVVTKLKKLRFKFMSLLVQRVESTVDRWIPSQRTRNAENISI